LTASPFGGSAIAGPTLAKSAAITMAEARMAFSVIRGEATKTSFLKA
jgi:hypothetical protein